MYWFLDVVYATLTMTVLAAPYILFGLLIAGLLHVLIPERLVLRWMGRPGMSGVTRAAAIGVPLPVCSCGVVPIAVELRRKGATTPATQSFLITTPESSIDSIFLTWGLMGPVMAIARPIAAFFTAVIGGVLSIAQARSLDELRSAWTRSSESSCEHDHGHAHDHHHEHGHHHHGHDHSHNVVSGDSSRAWASLRALLRRPRGFDASRSRQLARVHRHVVKPTTRYGFGELFDDLAFWLLVGLVLAGVVEATVPDDLGALGLGSGILPMILLLIVGIPIYMCASASTPIAAALLAKGVSPGAALVFLLAGPATNAATVLLLLKTFGGRFVRTYLISVVLGALTAGVLLDLFVGTDTVNALFTSDEALPNLFELLCGAVLGALILRSLYRGAWSAGLAEVRTAWGRMADTSLGRMIRPWATSRRVLVGLAVAAYLLTGMRVVPPNALGYGFTFGQLQDEAHSPGLHYHWPRPIGTWELRRVDYPRKTDIGFKTDPYAIRDRDLIPESRDRNAWHSPLAAMNAKPEQATFFTADEKFVEMSFSVHYGLSDPVAFLYEVDHRNDFVNLYAEAAAREFVAGTTLDELLTERRNDTEQSIAQAIQEESDRFGLGIQVQSVRVVDIHPPGAAVYAFRDVSSALEDRTTQVHEAHQRSERSLSLARGEASKLVASAEAEAETTRVEASGQTESFRLRADAFASDRELLRYLLRTRAAEEALAGRRKMILPEGVQPDSVSLWDPSIGSRNN